uniref:Putative mitogen-activated protein kinase kinase kinase 15 n=2 Tax=Ixodes ricinus TaxID=34613 RepID=V5H5F1_IXORI
MSRFASTGEDGTSFLLSSATATSPTEAIPRSPSTFSFGSETSESGMRRCSSGLLSPPVDGCSTDQESGGFYLLKKDSQRRQTILRVLEEDADTICDIWMSKLLQDIGGDLVISKEQLQSLLNGFKSYIPEQNKTGLQHAIGKLKQEVHHDVRAIGQLGVALYLFQSAVNEVLRNQSIKPHWMFALDSLVMNAAQVASEILSPGQEDPEENELEDAESTSGVSTINSAKSPSATQKQLANLARDYALPSGEAPEGHGSHPDERTPLPRPCFGASSRTGHSRGSLWKAAFTRAAWHQLEAGSLASPSRVPRLLSLPRLRESTDRRPWR